jgi:hypothetical protein
MDLGCLKWFKACFCDPIKNSHDIENSDITGFTVNPAPFPEDAIEEKKVAEN